MTNLNVRYTALTDVGLRRSDNQDSGFASKNLLLIADGMGGAAAGDLASATIANTLRQLDTPLEVEPIEALAGSVQRANDRLGDLIQEDPSIEGMGSTLTALLFDGEKFTVAHIGDSRGYRLCDGKLKQITKDHTFVQSLVDEGSLDPKDAREHPHRSLILRALLGRPDNEVDLFEEVPQVGDRYLLCSDGLNDMLTDEVIEELLATGSIDEAAVSLITAALEAGGVDNVTVIIGEIAPVDEPIDETLACANGQPQLVGAAARLPRPRTGNAPLPSGRSDEDEELRYLTTGNSNENKNRRRLIWLVALFAIVFGGGWAGYSWTQTKYFVSEYDGKVTIYRGVQANVPFIDLNSVEMQTTIDVASLPPYNQQLVQTGITAQSRAEADEIVSELKNAVVIQPSPSPTPSVPTTSPSPSPSAS